MSELTPERITEIRALIDVVPSMEYMPVPFGYGHQNRIAELDKDGNWRVWDSNVVLSDASCQLLAQGKQVIQELLDHIEALEEHIEELRYSAMGDDL